MPRQKQLTFHIQDLRCAGHIVEELSKLPQLDNFDMSSIELTIKENKSAPKIIKKDIDMLIDRLQRGFSANKHTVMQLNGYYLITNVHLAKWMRTTQASVNKWIKDGLIKPSKNSFTNQRIFQVGNPIIYQAYCVPLLYESRTVTPCHPPGCAYR